MTDIAEAAHQEIGQTEFTEAELLADHPIAEPLFAPALGVGAPGVKRVRCHGGFDEDGNYVSPRTLHRVPAVEAWQAKHTWDFGTQTIDMPLETWPAHFPNAAQARHLIKSGVREPLMATLTRIGTVEGFGANIRLLQPKGLQKHFVEDITGTAVDHLGRGLFEAHGRDEAGFEEDGPDGTTNQIAGHRDMWFAARDIAFPEPAPDVDIQKMLERMGFGDSPPQGGQPVRLLPDDIPADLEFTVGLMIRVLLIEISAFHTFAWAEDWLADADLVAGDGEAARLVSYIRADETPHVGYLATAVTELRDRTWIGEGGRRHAGTDMVGRLWDAMLEQSLGDGRVQTRKAILGEVEHWCGQHADGAAILEGFHALDTPTDAPAGTPE